MTSKEEFKNKNLELVKELGIDLSSQPNTTIEKATPEQFISGIKAYIEILECENEELKTRIKGNEYTIKQLKLILNSPVLEVTNNEN